MSTYLKPGSSWSEQLRRAKEEIDAKRQDETPPPRVPDPWEAVLASVKGETHQDQERIATSAAFDHLGLKRFARSSAAARRLARAMMQLGWKPGRWRPAHRPHQKVRGFMRLARASSADSDTPNLADA
jgi:hypothetical protein